MTRTLSVLLLSFALAPAAFAASTDSHTVTVTVSAINEVAISGGNLTLTIDSALPGGAPAPVTDTSASLDWTTNEATKKITVATDLAAPIYALTVEATGASGGTAAGVVTLSNVATDFVTDISNTSGACGLTYTATAEASDAVGTEVNTVTYTITS